MRGADRAASNAIRARRAPMPSLRALRQAALRLLIALALLAELIAWPTMAETSHAANATALAALHAYDGDTDPSPPAPADDDTALCADYADCEHGVLPQIPASSGRRVCGAALPEIARAAPARPHGPDPRPPLA
ncbi:hypothetical protein [Lysobacter enzymogenes]|uniref:hypothetical protein n=1 Tax=Lysobacter enzymogenes TaxID=69 RepID=UPI00089B3824|nr:hypothetical protein [Lysobacter enzymogenes]SDW91937.1 hypothetical protein SAMN05421681_103217 [Lysobacter enzymogenes]